MIVSSIRGRIRIRDERLKKMVFADSLKRRLESSEELLDVRINHRVGSMLIIYNPSTTNNKRLFELVGEDIVVKETTGDTSIKRDNKKILSLRMPKGITKAHKKIMLFSLAASLLGIAFGLKKYHVIAGFIFMGVWGIHLYIHKWTLLK